MFTNTQYCGMVLLYRQCNRNKREAAKQYAMKFPGEKHQSGYTAANAVKRLRETGSIQNRFWLYRFTDSTLRIPVEDVLGYALAHPEGSVREISKACVYSKSQVWKILNKYGAYAYRPILGHELLSGGMERCFEFCNFILNKQDGNPSFVNETLWTNECQFTRQGIVNTHNSHYWSLEYLHII